MFREEKNLAKINETGGNNSQDFFLLKETSKGSARMFNEQNKNGVRRCNKISSKVVVVLYLTLDKMYMAS